jgi:hypothetical protein
MYKSGLTIFLPTLQLASYETGHALPISNWDRLSHKGNINYVHVMFIIAYKSSTFIGAFQYYIVNGSIENYFL